MNNDTTYFRENQFEHQLHLASAALDAIKASWKNGEWPSVNEMRAFTTAAERMSEAWFKQ